MTHAAVTPYRLPPRISMVDAVRRCLRNYARFSGRAPRAEFWKFVLAVVLLGVASVVIHSLVWGPEVTPAGVGPDGRQQYSLRYHGGWIGRVVQMATVLPLLAVTWRRLHDTNVSGWWSLAPAAIMVVLIGGVGVATVGLAATLAAMRGVHPIEVTLPSPAGGSFFLLIFGSFLLLLLRLGRPGNPGRNRFGPNPLEVTP